MKILIAYVLEKDFMSFATQEKSRYIHLLILTLIAVYTLAFAFSYMDDPMALAPQLDAKENLALASQFADGTVAPEPFYRAVLYPWLLNGIASAELRPLAGLLLGLICHLGNAALVFLIAHHLWQRMAAGTIATCLYLLNPASLFFALQVLDMTLAITLFLGAILLALTRKERAPAAIATGILLGLCVLTRPHFLPVALLVPACAMLLSRWNIRLAAFGWGALIVVMLGQGMINFARSDQFRILPWQGSYNLYAANREGANGLYYKQTVDVSGMTYANPARAESEYLYQQATGATPPLDIGAMHAYWRTEALKTVLGNPAAWLRLMTFKAYAVVNAAEQYNNLTFSYHKARFPLLRFNPMNFGVLLVLGTLGGWILWKRRKASASVVIILILGYAVSLLIYYASARFRLPLVPLLAVLGGGVLAWPRQLFASRGTSLVAACLLLASGALAFSNFSDIRSRDTYVQDQLLLANANAELGRDVEAARFAHMVLWDHPNRREAQRIYTVSYFNLQLMQSPGADLFGDWQSQRQWVTQSPPTDPVQDVILGVYYWKWGQFNQAMDLWTSATDSGNPGSVLARACQAAVGLETSTQAGNSELVTALQNLLAE
ncbi:MAG: hypothetical protein AB3N33_08390 [Puniceicoccaceae bacterium]